MNFRSATAGHQSASVHEGTGIGRKESLVSQIASRFQNNQTAAEIQTSKVGIIIVCLLHHAYLRGLIIFCGFQIAVVWLIGELFYLKTCQFIHFNLTRLTALRIEVSHV